MDFPIADLMDEQACYDKLESWLHPDGLKCPRCGRDDRLHIHGRERAPVLFHRCRRCNRIFNIYAGTALQGTKRGPVQLMLILRGFAQGVPTARLARELGCDRMELLRFRRKLQGLALANRDVDPLPDGEAEADEMYQNAGEKRGAAPRSRRPAATPGEQATRPRDVPERPTAGLRRGRSGRGQGQAGGRRQLGRTNA